MFVVVYVVFARSCSFELSLTLVRFYLRVRWHFCPRYRLCASFTCSCPFTLCLRVRVRLFLRLCILFVCVRVLFVRRIRFRSRVRWHLCLRDGLLIPARSYVCVSFHVFVLPSFAYSCTCSFP